MRALAYTWLQLRPVNMLCDWSAVLDNLCYLLAV